MASQGGFASVSGLRRPFWLPAPNYYALALSVAAALFILVYGILHDGGDDTPLMSAGLAAVTVLVGAITLREIFLRRARNRVLEIEKSFDRQLSDVYSRIGTDRIPAKLTIEHNEALVRDIKMKSEAAKVLGRFAAGHREVFELCNEYLARNEFELKNIGAGSPRLGSLRKGKERVGRYHRFHILQWAQIEATALTLEAKSQSRLSEKIDAAQKAINVIDDALAHYPAEESLIESRAVLDELVTSIKVSDLIESAEKAAFSGDFSKARGNYRDALFYLARNNADSNGRRMVVEKIQNEMERLSRIEDSGN